MKKTKLIILALLSLTLLLPFMTPTLCLPVSAQVPDYVGVQVDDYYQWDQTINYGADFVQWFADNMTAHWDKVWGHTAGDDQTITSVHDSWAAAPGPSPRAAMPADIEVIYPENTTTGTTTVSGIGGYLVLNWPPSDNRWATNWTIANDTATFVQLTGSGSYMTTPGWLMYNYIFAPKNIDWAEYVTLGNIGLGAGGSNITNPAPDGWGANITLVEITDGFSMQVPVMGWWNNTLPITINTTYDPTGILRSYIFEYGPNTLFDIIRTAPSIAGIDPPMIFSSDVDFNVEWDYSNVILHWNVTDIDPKAYRVFQNGKVIGLPGFWTSGVEIEFPIDDGLAPGVYNFTIQLTDDQDHSTKDSIIMTVGAKPQNIPGYDIYTILGILSISMIIVMKRKKK